MSVAAEARRGQPDLSAWALCALSLVLVLVGIGWAAIQGSLWAAAGPFGQSQGQVATGELIAGRRIGQTFIADEVGLYRIDVDLGNYGRLIHGPLVLHVKAAPFVVPDLATASADASQLRANGFVSFVFAPLPEPAGLPLSFWLEAPQAQPGNAVTVLATGQDLYPNGVALFDQFAANGVQDLAFQLYYKPSISQALGVVIERQAQGRPALLGLPRFYVMLLGAYVLGLLALLALAFGRVRGKP